jgi:hypothetical protein
MGQKKPSMQHSEQKRSLLFALRNRWPIVIGPRPAFEEELFDPLSAEEPAAGAVGANLRPDDFDAMFPQQ